MRSRSSLQGENDIQIQIVANLSDKEYGEKELIHLVLEIHTPLYYHDQHFEDTNEDDRGETLNDAVDEVRNKTEQTQDKDSMMEYKHFILNEQLLRRFD